MIKRNRNDTVTEFKDQVLDGDKNIEFQNLPLLRWLHDKDSPVCYLFVSFYLAAVKEDFAN